MKPVQRSAPPAICLAILITAILAGCGRSPQSVPPLTITTPTLPNATVGTPYSQPIQASGGVGPYNWSITGALPSNLSLPPSAGSSVTISGTPDAAALGVAFTMQVSDSSHQTASQAYSVSVLTVADSISLSPTSLAFDAQMVAAASSGQTVTVGNTGSPVLTIAGIATSGNNPSEFMPITTCGSSLASGAECNITVTFAPLQPGPRSASLTINDDAPGSPQSIALNGVGVSPGINATLSATGLSFGTVPIGEGTTRSITLSNYGTNALSITGITASPNFSETSDCGAVLASGASCTINVTFEPTASGLINGVLSIADNAPDSPQNVSVSGVGFAGRCTLPGRGCNPAHNTCCNRCVLVGLDIFVCD